MLMCPKDSSRYKPLLSGAASFQLNKDKKLRFESLTGANRRVNAGTTEILRIKHQNFLGGWKLKRD